MIGRTFTLATCALAFAACTPGDEENRDSTPPFGYELAAAREAPIQAVEERVIDISVEQLQAKMDAGNTRLIDVRTDAEVAEGMIPGAEHIALDTFDPEVMDFSDGREIVIYCRSGRRSAIAGEKLASHTGEPAQHLAGGINAWLEAGQPIS